METKWTGLYGDYAFTPEINEEQSAYQAFRDAAKKYPDRTAVEYGKRKFTFSELLSQIDKYASVMAAHGVRRGDRVILSCRRMPHQIIAFYSLNKLGASVTFIMRNAGPEEFATLGRKLRANLMIFSVEIYNRYREMFIHTPIKEIILARSSDYAAGGDVFNPNIRDIKSTEKHGGFVEEHGPRISYWSDLLNEDAPDVDVDSEPDDTAVIFSTGAAAGTVNAVKISSRAMNAQAKISAFLYGKEPRRVFSFIRLDFSFGTCFALHTSLVNGNTYLVNTQRDLEFSWRDINIYRPDVIIGYPQMITALVDSKRVSQKSLTSIRTIFSCGNTMSGADYHRICDFFKKKHINPRITRIYGITETASTFMFLPEEEIRPSVLGIPLPGVRMKILDPNTNAEKMYGETGVIAINTPSSMSGYVESDDDTDSVLRTLNDNRLWIMSGDLGYEDENGMFYYSGTRRRLFDRGGMHVFPQVIEEIIRSVLGVENCCAVPLERDGKTIIKVAIKPESEYLFNNDKLNEIKDDIERTCMMEMPEPMRPDEYEFMAYLPEERYGRVDYEKIITMFKEEENE